MGSQIDQMRQQQAQLKQQQAALAAQQAQATKERQRALMDYSSAHSRAVSAAGSAPAEIRRPLQSALTSLHEAVHGNEGISDRVNRAFMNHPPEQQRALRQQAIDTARSQVQDALQQAKDAAKQFKTAMIQTAGTMDPGDASEATILDRKGDVRDALQNGKSAKSLLQDALERGDDLTAHVLTGEPGRMMLQARGIDQAPLQLITAQHRIGQQQPDQYLAPVQSDSAVRLALGNDLDNVLSQAEALSQ